MHVWEDISLCAQCWPSKAHTEADWCWCFFFPRTSPSKLLLILLFKGRPDSLFSETTIMPTASETSARLNPFAWPLSRPENHIANCHLLNSPRSAKVPSMPAIYPKRNKCFCLQLEQTNRSAPRQ